MKRADLPVPSRRGFSLLEMLMAVMIIGIMCGIAVAVLNQPQREAISQAARQQNASALATMAVCLEVAGVPAVVPDDLEGTIRRLMRGVIPETGPLAGHRFVVSGIEDAEVPSVARFLSIETGELIYHPESTQAPGS